jgi:rhodanese-related sulfurtransferase
LIPNYQVGGYYLTGSLALVALVPTLWPWTSILLWAVLSLGITGAAYWKLGPAIYRKTNGRLPLSARLLFAPNLIGQYASLRWYRRHCDAWNVVTPSVWIGARLNRREAREAKAQGVTAVLDLTAEFSEPREFLELNYRNIPVLDLTGLTVAQLREAADFISEQAREGIVYVHCKVGYSRSAAAVAAWLLASGQVSTAEEGFGRLREVRPSIIIRPEIVDSVKAFEAAAIESLNR